MTSSSTDPATAAGTGAAATTCEQALPAGLVLRRLTPADAAAISALESRAFPSFWTAEQYARELVISEAGAGCLGVGAWLSGTKHAVQDASEARLAEEEGAAQSESGEASGESAAHEGQLAGYIVLSCAAGECEVANIAVDLPFRSRGIASVLLARALQEARKMHNIVCYLEVAVGNIPARALYTRAGFRQTGLRRKYYRETGEDALVMMLELT